MITTIAGEVLQRLLVGLSAFAVGLGLYVAWINVHEARRAQDRYVARYRWSAVLTLVSMAGTWVVVAESVLRAAEIPPTWRTVLYTLFLMCGALGMLGLAVNWRRFHHDRHDRRKLDP